MKLLTFLLLLFNLSVSQEAFACDCESQGEFLTVAPKSKLVALVKVTKYLTFKDIYDKPMPMSMQVEIIEIYKGKESRKTIIVWGDDGNLCRPYLNRFEVGKYYVMAFDNAGIPYRKTEPETDYAISVCGDFWLTADVKKKVAAGAVSKKMNQITFADLRKKFLIK